MIIKKKQICLILGQALAAGLFSTGTNAVFAQAPTPTERITVTGSNISRASAEGVLPVQTISREAIQSSAAATAGELLQNLVSNSSGTFSTASGTGNDWSGVNFANLRGIGSSSTLILLNGRRVASFAIGAAGVDLNSIPLAAIDRIEVLRDGASAIYGADAIGGVINFITKPSYVGVEAGANYQIADGGVGAERRVNASIGFGDFDKENFNIMIAADRTTTAAIHSSVVLHSV